MDWTSIILIAVVSLLLLKVLFGKKKESTRPILYMRRDALFTAAERSFLSVLDRANDGRYRIFGKVRIADVLMPIRGLEKSTWTKAFNRISAKHFDFVLCDPQTLEVKAVIELNDKSHSSGRRVERDRLIERACAEAGLALRAIKARRGYSLEAVKQIVSEIEIELRPDEPLGSRGPTREDSNLRSLGS